jgi:hypothetical protein
MKPTNHMNYVTAQKDKKSSKLSMIANKLQNHQHIGSITKSWLKKLIQYCNLDDLCASSLSILQWGKNS